MKYRNFGRSGIQVSELVFGGGWVGGILIHQDDDTRREAIRRALAAGINWIDTAAQYGQGRSEEALGWLLKEIDEQPYLSTKFRLDDGEGDFAGAIERSLAESLGRLGRDRVDLLQLHNPIGAVSGDGRVSPADVLGTGGIADALEGLRGQGLFDHVGMTALGEADPICEVIDSGRFDSAQVYYNLLNPSADWDDVPAGWSGHDFAGVVAACHRHGTAIMNIRVFASGAIATDERHGREAVLTEGSELDVEARRAGAVFERLGDAYGTRAQTAIRYALANNRLDCVVLGLGELSHLDEAIAAAELGPLPADALEALHELQLTDFS